MWVVEPINCSTSFGCLDKLILYIGRLAGYYFRARILP
jgi:hypothetical protein